MNVKIADRIREERKRLGFATQALLADKLGISASSVHNYEAGKRSPDADFISAFGEIGADVLFVITGKRTVTALAPDEAALLDNYRNTPPARRSTLQEVSAAFAEQDGLTTKTSGG